MPELTFRVEGAKRVPFAASPLLALELAITSTPGDEAIHGVLLQCQVRIDAPMRSYAPGEQERLLELFGTPDLWSRSVKSLLWTQASVMVPRFTASALVDLLLPCSSDFSVAASKYFYALEAGEIPLVLLFSGTVLHGNGALSASQIAWSKEATYRLPVPIYKDTIDHYYPNQETLSLRRDVFDRLYRHRLSAGLHTWEEALERLLPAEDVRS